ncbi:MAG: YdjY domain-containing protein [Chitinivibrionales bacterium]|nr:YdjY domain-containing protein [Chitinivibrionales bacterium]
MRPLFILLALIFSTSFGNEKNLFSIDFSQKIPSFKTKSGSWKKKSEGLFLGRDSKIVFPLKTSARLNNAGLRVGFIPPEIKKSAMPTESGVQECFCAFKIALGRCVVELSDKGFFLERLDSTLSAVDSLLAVMNWTQYPSQGEMILSLSVVDRMASVCLNDSLCLSAAMPPCSFDSVEIATYRNPFTLTIFSASALIRDSIRIDKKNKNIKIAGVYHSSHFNAGKGQHNHSLVTWEGGSAAENALFTTVVPDSAICDALESLGEIPGNNLKLYPWSEISDLHNKAPDETARGPACAIEIIFAGKSFAVSRILADENNKPFEFRFSGNRASIPTMRTGCVVCLESCPGGKVDNSSYTMRDLIKQLPRFHLLPGLPFMDEDEVTLQFSFLPERAGGSAAAVS